MTGSYKDVLRQLTYVLATEENFDVIRRDLIIGERPAALFFMDAFIKDETFEKIFEFLYKKGDLKYFLYFATIRACYFTVRL